jgi:purine-binding chemotaxis protein CheW
MAIPIEYVDRIMSVNAITKIPLSFDYIEGALTYHDEIISVLNLKRLFEIKDDYQYSDGFQVIIVQTPQNKAAILIDEIKGIDIIEKGSPRLEINNKYIFSLIEANNQIISILKPEIIELCKVR